MAETMFSSNISPTPIFFFFFFFFFFVEGLVRTEISGLRKRNEVVVVVGK